MTDGTHEPPPDNDRSRRYEPDASPFQARQRAPLLRRTFPVSANLAGYPERNARRDVIAGLTIAALALPSGNTPNSPASPPCRPLRSPAPAVAYTLLGSSRQVIVSS